MPILIRKKKHAIRKTCLLHNPLLPLRAAIFAFSIERKKSIAALYYAMCAIAQGAPILRQSPALSYWS